MKFILGTCFVILCSYLLISWAVENPRDARRVTKQAEEAANTLVDKSQRAAHEMSK
jgi:hypothetical protein